jgi:hypothetical protein
VPQLTAVMDAARASSGSPTLASAKAMSTTWRSLGKRPIIRPARL